MLLYLPTRLIPRPPSVPVDKEYVELGELTIVPFTEEEILELQPDPEPIQPEPELEVTDGQA